MFLDTKTLFPYLHTGEVYDQADPALFDAQRSCLKYINDFNASPYDALDYRDELLRKMCWSIGEGCFIEAPMRSNFGCNHLILGNNVYVNYDACFVDDTFITIGDNTMIGPRCVIATASHPEDPELRALGYQLCYYWQERMVRCQCHCLPWRHHWRQQYYWCRLSGG